MRHEAIDYPEFESLQYLSDTVITLRWIQKCRIGSTIDTNSYIGTVVINDAGKLQEIREVRYNSAWEHGAYPEPQVAQFWERCSRLLNHAGAPSV